LNFVNVVFFFLTSVSTVDIYDVNHVRYGIKH
jgi:hypothetical protein